MTEITTAENINNYIADFSIEVQKKLEEMRSIIKKAAPEATETISYGIPTFLLNGNLVHFGGFKNHIGFYPGPAALITFKKELEGYKGAKGSVQFPLDKPLPKSIISKIVKLRAKENLQK